MNITFIPAIVSDCDLLTNTAKIAKQHWGYSDELIEIWHNDLAVIPEDFSNCKLFKAFAEGNFIGFYKLLDKGNYCELDGLWILPAFHGNGFGRSIMQHAFEVATQLGYDYIKLFADPHVNGFYEKIGGQLKGKKETVVKDRYLNIYHFEL